MNIAIKTACVLASLGVLAGCGGGTSTAGLDNGNPSGTPTGPTSPTGPNSPVQTGGASFATGIVENATAGVPGRFDMQVDPPRTIAPQTIRYVGASGPNRVTYGPNLIRVIAGGRGFIFKEGTDGQSFALIGNPPNQSGSFISAASPAPTSGTVAYTGRYFGIHNGGRRTVTNPFIEGDVSLTANFSDDTFSGRIANRTVNSGGGNVNLATMTEDVQFSGSVSADGIMQGTHVDSNSTGDVNAVAFGSGAVGTVAVTHTEGRELLFPTGVFPGDPCGFGASASCTLDETGVFAVE